MAKFVIAKSKDNQYYFVLVASNGEVICTSETYTTVQSCKKGIQSVKRNAIFATIVKEF
jgi:uncharacterized protein YegP (UPF0339 family)